MMIHDDTIIHLCHSFVFEATLVTGVRTKPKSAFSTPCSNAEPPVDVLPDKEWTRYIIVQ